MRSCVLVCTTPAPPQGLSNGVPFGEKEKHMMPLNDFFGRKRPELVAFLRELTSVEDVQSRMEVVLFFIYVVCLFFSTGSVRGRD